MHHSLEAGAQHDGLLHRKLWRRLVSPKAGLSGCRYPRKHRASMHRLPLLQGCAYALTSWRIGATCAGGFDSAVSSYEGLLSLARSQGAVGGQNRGACKRCGQLGHLTKQCRNFINLAEAEKTGAAVLAPVLPPVAEGKGEDDDSSDLSLSSSSSDSDSSSSSSSGEERRRRKEKERKLTLKQRGHISR